MKLRVNTQEPHITAIKASRPVTSPEIYDQKTGLYHRDGIFSEQIFGPVKNYECQCGFLHGKQHEGEICPHCGVKITSSFVRRITYSWIDLPFEIPHPLALFFLFKKNRTLQNTFLSARNDIFNVMETIIQELNTTDDPKIANLRNHNLIYTKKIPVIPPELRPLINKFKADDINSHYVNILEAINRHMLTYTNEHLQYILTRRFWDLYNFVFERVPKKEGLIRQALLGKETDFSARTVIVPNPTLPIDTIAVSKWILLDVLKPLLIHHLFSLDILPTYANEMIDKAIHSKESNSILDSILEQVIEQHNLYAAFNRQPTLHRGSLMGFKLAISDGDVIEINPVICPPYNADFDGDSVYGRIVCRINGKVQTLHISELEQLDV